MGSFVYLVFAVINLFALSPVTGTKDPDNSGTIGEPYGKHPPIDYTKAEKARLIHTVRGILGNNPSGVCERELSGSEIDPMLNETRPILGGIPNEPGLSQRVILR